MKFIDLFAGIGGFRLPLERLGFECVWSSEIDKYARQVYRYHWEEPAGDIRQIKPEEIPDFDLLCAGFPCQSFSISGKRAGFKDTRGTLFFEICKILRAKKPKVVLLENVKGLLSIDNYTAFRTILKSLRDIGYMGSYQIINSKYFGVPQNRERVFIIGYLGKGPGPKVFPIGESDNVSNEGNQREKGRREPSRETTNALRGCGELKIPMVIQNKRQSNEIRIKDICPTVTSYWVSGGGNLPYIQNIPHGRNDGWKKPLPNLRHHDGAAYNELLVKGAKIRRLTPIECERLQGFPDNWTKYGSEEDGSIIEISDTQRYRQLGNAVTVPVIYEIGKRLRDST